MSKYDKVVFDSWATSPKTLMCTNIVVDNQKHTISFKLEDLTLSVKILTLSIEASEDAGILNLNNLLKIV